MRLESFLAIDDVEVSNAARTLDYIRAGLADPRVEAAARGLCECAAYDEGPYVSPADDPAPWFDAALVQSERFLGVLMTEMRFTEPGSRTATPIGRSGATIGPLFKGPRVLTARGIMFARDGAAMFYGERWLQGMLLGTQACGDYTVRVLAACPQAGDPDQFRTLYRCGLVETVVYGQIQSFPECVIEQVSFQIAAGVPDLWSTEELCMDEPLMVGS